MNPTDQTHVASLSRVPLRVRARTNLRHAAPRTIRPSATSGGYLAVPSGRVAPGEPAPDLVRASAGSSTQTRSPCFAGDQKGQARHGSRTIPGSSHPRAYGRRDDALAHAAWGQTRARRPSRQGLNLTSRQACALSSDRSRMTAPHPAPIALAAVPQGHQRGVQTVDPVAFHPSPAFPPSPAQSLCPIRWHSMLAALRGGGGACIGMKTHAATGPRLRWRGRGQASWVGPVVGGELTSAGLHGAAMATGGAGVDARERIRNRTGTTLRDRGREGGVRGAFVARHLRVFAGLNFPVWFPTAQPTQQLADPVCAPICAALRASR